MPQQGYDAPGVRFRVPPLACDCHMHVFGELALYPPARQRSYTPQAALLPAWRQVAQSLGIERVVVVQASAYGADNRCVVDALLELGPVARGVAQLDETTSSPQLEALHAAGVRGVRLNPKSAGVEDLEGLRVLVRNTAAKVAPYGWHVELHAKLAQICALADTIGQAPAPLVLDHMGGARADEGRAAIRPLLDLLARGRCWAKLSGAYRVSQRESGFEDATPIAKALIEANPDQVVWGTDWPHTRAHGGADGHEPPPIGFRALNQAALLDLLADASGDQATFSRILVANPARLYGF